MLESILLIVLVIFLSIMYQRRRHKKLPPGPWCFPFIGYAPFLRDNPFPTYKKLWKKYGPVFSLQIGTEKFVMINSYELIYEALVKKHKVFSGRPKFPLFDKLSDGNGVIFVDGKYSTLHRNFQIKAINEFAKNHLENCVQEEAKHFTNIIEQNSNQSFNCEDAIEKTVANVSCGLILGQRFPYENQCFKDIYSKIKENGNNPLIPVLIVAYWTRLIPAIKKEVKKFFENHKYTAKLITQTIELYRNNASLPRNSNYVDKFLEETLRKRDSFSVGQLTQCSHELFGASIHTTSTAIRWCILGLIHYPEYQEKIYNEICKFKGSHSVSIADQHKMTFTRAYMQEVMRYHPIIPQSIRRTVKDTRIGGYLIPKNTTTMFNFWEVHHNPTFFTNPEKFSPERFIDANNCFIHSDRVIPFSIGPRHCPGRRIAKNEIFAFLTNIIQKFIIKPSAEKQPPAFDKGMFGAAHAPSEFNVVFQPRT